MTNIILFCLLTIVAYYIGLYVNRRGFGVPPFVTGCFLLLLALYCLSIDYATYRESAWPIIALLTPALVCTAIPLSQMLSREANKLPHVLSLCLVGAILSAVVAVALAYLTTTSDLIINSSWVKSTSAPFAMLIAPTIEGHADFAAGLVAAVGVAGGITGPVLFKHLRLKDQRWQGLILGITAHGIGMGIAFRRSATCGAYATLGMSITGVFTAFLISIFL